MTFRWNDCRMICVAQPWADFLVPSPTTKQLCRAIHGQDFVDTLPKPIENRGWKTGYRGPLLIHATGFERRDRDAMHHYGLTGHEKAFVYGAVIGGVDLVDVTDDWLHRLEFPDEPDPDLPAWGMAGCYHWHTRDQARLRTAVHCQGFQGIRRPTQHVLANVLSQFAATAAAGRR